MWALPVVGGCSWVYARLNKIFVARCWAYSVSALYCLSVIVLSMLAASKIASSAYIVALLIKLM